MDRVVAAACFFQDKWSAVLAQGGIFMGSLELRRNTTLGLQTE